MGWAGERGGGGGSLGVKWIPRKIFFLNAKQSVRACAHAHVCMCVRVYVCVCVWVCVWVGVSVCVLTFYFLHISFKRLYRLISKTKIN